MVEISVFQMLSAGKTVQPVDGTGAAWALTGALTATDTASSATEIHAAGLKNCSRSGDLEGPRVGKPVDRQRHGVGNAGLEWLLGNHDHAATLGQVGAEVDVAVRIDDAMGERRAVAREGVGCCRRCHSATGLNEDGQARGRAVARAGLQRVGIFASAVRAPSHGLAIAAPGVSECAITWCLTVYRACR